MTPTLLQLDISDGEAAHKKAVRADRSRVFPGRQRKRDVHAGHAGQPHAQRLGAEPARRKRI